MSSVRRQTHVAAPLEVVWDLVGDPNRHPEWFPKVVQAKCEGIEEGCSYRMVVKGPMGNTIDETAMIEALEDGRIGFAALDVFEHEPLDPASPLWDMPNVLVSPHGAAINTDEERLIAELFAANATRLIDGVPLVNRVNTVEFY